MQLDTERRSIISALTKGLIEAARAGGGAVHILSGLPGTGKTHSVNSYLQPQAKQEGIEACFMNCYAARNEVLALQPRPQTIYVIDEFDTLFAFTDQRTADSLSPLRALAASNPVLGLMNDFTVELQSRVSAFFGTSIKPHIHSFPAPSTGELASIAQSLLLDAELVADSSVFTFLASQIVSHRNGDIRVLVRTVQNLRFLGDGAGKVGLKDAHRALNQVLQRTEPRRVALELSEMEARVLGIVLDHDRESNSAISVLEVRRGYRAAMGVDIDVPEVSIRTALDILVDKGVLVGAVKTRTRDEGPHTHKRRMKSTAATFGIHKYYRLNSARYSYALLRNACEAALAGSGSKAGIP